MVEEVGETFVADFAPSYVPVAVAAAAGFVAGVVGVEEVEAGQAGGGVDLVHEATYFTGVSDVVAGGEGVAGVEGDAEGGVRDGVLDGGDEVGHVAVGAAGAVLAGGVLQQYGGGGFGFGQGAREGFGGAVEGPVGVVALAAAGVDDVEVGADAGGGLQFPAHALDAAVADGVVGAAGVDEVAGVDGDGGEFGFGAGGFEVLDFFVIALGGGPGARVAAEDLEAGAVALDGAVDGAGETAGDGDVEAEGGHRKSE